VKKGNKHGKTLGEKEDFKMVEEEQYNLFANEGY
jgi:hypothetical protein